MRRYTAARSVTGNKTAQSLRKLVPCGLPAPMETSARARSTITTTAQVGKELPPPLPPPPEGVEPPLGLGLLPLPAHFDTALVSQMRGAHECAGIEPSS